MLELENIELLNNHQHLVKDVSLRFSDRGCVSIMFDDVCSAYAFARVLAGIEKPYRGIIRYDGHELNWQKEKELAHYRQSYTSSLFGDFQIQLEKSIIENITMGLQVQHDHLMMILKKWRLTSLQTERAEDVDFITKAKVALARIELHAPSMLIFLPDSTPYSKQELEQLYLLFTLLGKHILVVVIRDATFERFANRILSFEDGYLISDNQNMQENRALKMRTPYAFHVPKTCVQSLMNMIYHHHRWAYRALAILFAFALLFVSSFIFTYQLNTVDMEVRTLQSENANFFAIQKRARGNDGTTYASLYMPFDQQDKQELEELLDDRVITASYPIDIHWANAYLEGRYEESQYTLFSYAAVVELPEQNLSENVKLHGNWPQNIGEAVLSMSDARILLKGTMTLTYEDYIGQSFYWYGVRLTVSGILDESLFRNMETLNTWGEVSNTRILVKEGFMDEHLLKNLQSFPISYKRALYNNTIYAFTCLYPISQVKNYMDGNVYTYNHALDENDAILNYDMAVTLGFEPDYEANYLKNLENYQLFARKWVGRHLQVQAYNVEVSPNNSTLFEKNVNIRGFSIPQEYDFINRNNHNKSVIYVENTAIDHLMVENVGYENIYYMNNDMEQIRKALTLLEEHPLYEATLPSGMALQNLVRDLKELDTFLLLAAGACLGVSLFLYLLLMYKTREHTRKEMTIYYALGETRGSIIALYMKNSTRILIRDLFIATTFTTVLLSLLTSATIWKLFASSQLFWILMIPLFVSIFIFFFLQFICYLMLRYQPLLEEDYNQHGNVWYQNKIYDKIQK